MEASRQSEEGREGEEINERIDNPLSPKVCGRVCVQRYVYSSRVSGHIISVLIEDPTYRPGDCI